MLKSAPKHTISTPTPSILKLVISSNPIIHTMRLLIGVGQSKFVSTINLHMGITGKF